MGYNWERTLAVGQRVTRKGYDPDQPRDPAGTSTGGQWTASDAGTHTGGATAVDPVAQRFSGDNFRAFNEASQADQVLRKRYQGWADSLTKEEIEAVKSWQVGRYDHINETLQRDEATSEVALLDSAIGKSAAPYNIVALRATRPREFAVGDVFTEKGYTSTTVAPYILDRYRRQRGPDAVIMRVRIRGGQQAAYLSAAHDTGDYEVLLPRNVTFRVSGVSRGDVFGVTSKIIDVDLLD